MACLREGLESGHGGELRVTFTTIEGDPIIDYVRVLPARQRKRTVEIYQDSTADKFADPDGGGWWHGVCPASSSLAQLEDGSPVGC